MIFRYLLYTVGAYISALATGNSKQIFLHNAQLAV